MEPVARNPGLPFLLVFSQLLPSSASAQHAQDNVVTAASDAFGTAVGSQAIGLYTPGNARGFSPADAQNIRIEGLYFDQQTGIDPYLFSGSDMRVGIAAQSYAFPSPSGIADLKLRSPGDSGHASVLLDYGPFRQLSAELDTQYPLMKSVSIGLNIAATRNSDPFFARSSNSRAISLIARFRPDSGSEFVPFFGYIHNSERQESPIVFSDRAHAPPLFDQLRLPTQEWTSKGWNQITGGVIAKIPLATSWRLSAGLFHSAEVDAPNFTDLLLGATPDGLADHVIDISPAHTWSSYSGDIRVTRSLLSPRYQGELTVSVRGRYVKRHYGGDSVTDLGSTTFDQIRQVREPALRFSEQSGDTVRQAAIGISYTQRWSERASADLGILTTDYTRKLSFPNLSAGTQRTTVALPTASFTIGVGHDVTIYGSYTRGLEDSSAAPASALNRGEPPPATPTWQVDGGIRVTPLSYLQLLAGPFAIHKTYFGVNTLNRYAELGEISSRGIEGSAVLKWPAGLTVVAGGVWLHPEVKRKALELGGSGNVPIGPVPRTININADYAPSGWRGWGVALQWTSMSSRAATSDELYTLPPLATLNIGARYAFKAFQQSCSVHLDAWNATNTTGLTLSTAYSATSQPRRGYSLAFAADM